MQSLNQAFSGHCFSRGLHSSQIGLSYNKTALTPSQSSYNDSENKEDAKNADMVDDNALLSKYKLPSIMQTNVFHFLSCYGKK